MPESLSLFDCLLETARRQARSQQVRLAIASLRHLARFPDLPPSTAKQVWTLLGELYLRRRKFTAARICLSRAARVDRTCARTLFLLGLACHHDPRGDLDRAARHYQRSLAQAPEQIRCLGEAGLLAILRGDDEHGLTMLYRAAELAPDNVAAMTRLCQGLRQSGRPEEALREVRLALFRLPRSATLRQLSADILLDRLRCRQACDASEQARGADAAVILPFLQVVGSGVTLSDGGELRLHQPEPPRGPHLFRMHQRRSWRRAP